MRQYLTELREKWRGDRWAGPVIEADNLVEAKKLMRMSPYKVVGELVQTVSTADGTVERYIRTEDAPAARTVVH